LFTVFIYLVFLSSAILILTYFCNFYAQYPQNKLFVFVHLSKCVQLQIIFSQTALYGFRAKYLRPVPKSIIMVNGSNFA